MEIEQNYKNEAMGIVDSLLQENWPLDNSRYGNIIQISYPNDKKIEILRILNTKNTL